MNEEILYEEPIAQEQQSVTATEADEHQQTTQDQDEQTRQEEVVETKQDRNFRELRESRERAQKERDEAIRRLQEYEARNNFQPPKEEPDELELDPDSLVEGKHMRTVSKRIKHLEKSLEKATETAIETSLRAKYTDFDKVVNAENIQLLRDLYPEVASVIGSSSDLYSKSVAAYNFIKDKGLGEIKEYDNDRELAQRNANKPRPVVSAKPTSPLGHVNEFADGPLTKEYKDRLYKEMLELAKRS